MFKNYLEYKEQKSYFFVYHNLKNLFKRIEIPFFSFLCLILIIISKTNNGIVNTVSMKVAEYSTPVSKTISLPINFIVKNIIDFQDLIYAQNKNLILTRENEKLKSLYIQSLNIQQENFQLREIIRYTGARSTKYLVARLVAQPYQTYNNNVFIDSGSTQGVREGDIVVGHNALIGRIDQVGEYKSRVLLATDINSHIPIIISGANVKGILVGNNSNVMKILYLDKLSKINIGDMVFTSGDGDSIPPGLLIGIITEFDNGDAKVEMAENIKDLDMVSVINY